MKKSYLATYYTNHNWSFPCAFTNKKESIRYIRSVGLGNTPKGEKCTVFVAEENTINEVYRAIIHNR